MPGRTTGTMLAVISAIALGHVAEAQQQAQPASTQAVKTFEPGFFARYSPVTAFDMVRQLPGFIIDNGDSLRGFGATAGNVLIDGQRPSSKNSISDELTRISARDVMRIELIGAAAAGDIDVRGYTELANVVLKSASAMQVSTNWRGDLAWQGEHVAERLGGTRSWKTDNLGVRLNAQVFGNGQREETDITVRNAAGAVTSTREEFNQQFLSEFLLNATVNWTPTARDAVNFTGRVTPRAYQRNFGSIRRTPAGVADLFATDDYTEKDILHAELGGDWEHKFSPSNSVKLILVNRLVNWRPQELFEQFAPGGARIFAQEINTDLKSGEHVARGVWTLKPTDKHTVEFGLEGAFNYRDQFRSVANSNNGGPVFTPAVLPVASTRVEEVRGEAFATDTWRVTPQLTLELGLTYEASKITQTGDAEQEREFTYPKPRFVSTWLPTKEDQLRLSIERTVAQLDFSEFASTILPLQGQITIGNPDLEPQQALETTLQWKRTLGQRGSISITGFYHQIEDVQDFIPIRPPIAGCAPNSTDPMCVFTAAGNIGDGERWGGRIEATFPLDGFIKGGVLKINAGARDTKVTDPITGEERKIANQNLYDWNIDFRQDLPDLKLAWGGDYTDVGESEAFRLDEEQTRSFGPGDLDLFVETTYFKGVTVRLAGDNLGSQPARLDRRFFTPNRFLGGAFLRSEYRDAAYGPNFTISVLGAF
jgi:outer membrane receptor protein involved in Fe transport